MKKQQGQAAVALVLAWLVVLWCLIHTKVKMSMHMKVMLQKQKNQRPTRRLMTLQKRKSQRPTRRLMTLRKRKSQRPTRRLMTLQRANSVPAFVMRSVQQFTDIKGNLFRQVVLFFLSASHILRGYRLKT
jgi:hypothetical protein